ncbi:unnamed protein product [Rangifer tarandus platyrhynchus]|uniref:Uncharacterized protein n=1 Tax=Rangifer tarandus platyrhynchus TaxID=3082113 RepID=A0AC59YL09_RANTA
MCPKSTRDEARFPCIDATAIPRSPFNSTGGSTSFTKLQGCPENTVPSVEEHQLQHSNSRNAPCTPNRLESHSPFPIQLDRWLDFLHETPGLPREHCPKCRGTPTSAQQLEECSVYPKSSRDES